MDNNTTKLLRDKVALWKLLSREPGVELYETCADELERATAKENE